MSAVPERGGRIARRSREPMVGKPGGIAYHRFAATRGLGLNTP